MSTPDGVDRTGFAGRIQDALQGLAERSKFLVFSQDPFRYAQIFPLSWTLGGRGLQLTRAHAYSGHQALCPPTPSLTTLSSLKAMLTRWDSHPGGKSEDAR